MVFCSTDSFGFLKELVLLGVCLWVCVCACVCLCEPMSWTIPCRYKVELKRGGGLGAAGRWSMKGCSEITAQLSVWL